MCLQWKIAASKMFDSRLTSAGETADSSAVKLLQLQLKSFSQAVTTNHFTAVIQPVFIQNFTVMRLGGEKII